MKTEREVINTEREVKNTTGPILEMLRAYRDEEVISFHTPGHKGGKAFDAQGDGGVRENLYTFDVTEIQGSDSLYSSKGVIKESKDRAAEILGAKRVDYLVNGSTAGVLAMLTSQLKPGDEILIPRDVHQSALHGLILGRIRPRWIEEEIEEQTGLIKGVSLKKLQEAYGRHPEAKAVFLTHPTYYGLPSEIEKIREWTERRSLLLLVDQAHGAHFHLSPESFPLSAVAAGADLTVMSLHKTLPSLTQTAVLVMQGGRIDEERLDRTLRIHQTSSPSYLFLASIEGVFSYSEGKGKQEMKRLLAMIDRIRPAFGKMKGFDLYTFEPTKLWIAPSYEGITGHGIKAVLRKKYGIEMELSTKEGVLAIVTPGNREKDLKKLVFAFEELEKTLYNKKRITTGRRQNAKKRNGVSESEALPLWDAFYRKRKWVSIEISEGKIAGDFLTPYPPGIPLLMPGERITEEHLAIIREDLKEKKEVTGVQGDSPPGVSVIEEEE